MSGLASEAEIKKAVAFARGFYPDLPDGLTARFAAARMTIDEVRAQLFEEITEGRTAKAVASIVAFASKRRSGPQGGDAA